LKKILIIAFHFPPFKGSSGIQRTVKFAHYLPDFGWEPIILTASPGAYGSAKDKSLKSFSRKFIVKRSFAMDSGRLFSFRGFYPKWLALPDRWASWWISAVRAGADLIRRHDPDVIWSTYPIATAHLIGLTLHKLFGKPWVADFRDPMTEENYPFDRIVRRVNRWLEHRTLKNSAISVFTTGGALEMYAARYPDIPRGNLRVVANGYDEEDFAGVNPVRKGRKDNAITLVHSGLIYPWERDPQEFFAALDDLKRRGEISSSTLRVVLRGSGHEELYEGMLEKHGIRDIISLEKPIAYREAIREMISSDGLLVFQASNCNRQVPVKIYEYFRARRPIFAMTDPKGDTARVLRSSGINTMARLDSKDEIAARLSEFLRLVKQDRAPIANSKEIDRHSRKYLTEALAGVLNSLG
jgi:glycosyltransferase involved in cell wall biosynthesis